MSRAASVAHSAYVHIWWTARAGVLFYDATVFKIEQTDATPLFQLIYVYVLWQPQTFFLIFKPILYFSTTASSFLDKEILAALLCYGFFVNYMELVAVRHQKWDLKGSSRPFLFSLSLSKDWNLKVKGQSVPSFIKKCWEMGLPLIKMYQLRISIPLKFWSELRPWVPSGDFFFLWQLTYL